MPPFLCPISETIVSSLLDSDAGISYTLSKSGRPAIFARDPDGNALEFTQSVAVASCETAPYILLPVLLVATKDLAGENCLYIYDISMNISDVHFIVLSLFKMLSIECETFTCRSNFHNHDPLEVEYGSCCQITIRELFFRYRSACLVFVGGHYVGAVRDGGRTPAGQSAPSHDQRGLLLVC